MVEESPSLLGLIWELAFCSKESLESVLQIEDGRGITGPFRLDSEPAKLHRSRPPVFLSRSKLKHQGFWAWSNEYGWNYWVFNLIEFWRSLESFNECRVFPRSSHLLSCSWNNRGLWVCVRWVVHWWSLARRALAPWSR